MSEAINNGVKKYVEAAKRSLAQQEAYKAEMRKCRFDTIAVHGLYSANESLNFNQGAIIEPIYMCSSQAYRDSDEMEAALSYQIPTWCYSRIGNPTVYYFENTMALLEGYGLKEEVGCCATSSGMSAIQSSTDPFLVIDPKKPNQKMNFVTTCQVYGGTFQQFNIRKMQERGVECRWILNSADIEEWKSKIDENTRFVYGELPSNPGQAFFDLEKVAKLAHAFEAPLIIDNTVASPALLRPLCHGADIVIQSVTKSLCSSGFGIGGAVIAKKNITSKIGPDEMKENFAFYLKALPNRDHGQNISPMNAILAMNDMRTLRSKMDMFSKNTMKVAKFLETHKKIEKVDYLGLESHNLHNLASKYLFLVDSEYDEQYGKKVNRYGHLMSFRVKGGAAPTRKMFDALKRIWRATDLGRIKSVATIPAISTHSQQGEEGRKMADVPPNMVRLCVGAEHPDDVIADLTQALDAIDGKVQVAVPTGFSIGGASHSSAKEG